MGIVTKVLDAVTDLFPPAKVAKDIIRAIAGGTGKSEDELTALEPQVAALVVQRDISRDAQVEESIRTQLETRARIIESDNKSGDKWTRRARPSVVYSGIAMFGIEFIVRVIAVFSKIDLPDSTLVPEPMIYSWTVVSSVWAGGRTIEKVQEIRNGKKDNGSTLLKTIMG